MTESEHTRWRGALAYAAKQRCDAAASCDYADWIVEGVRDRRITLPAPHAPLFAQWLRINGG